MQTLADINCAALTQRLFHPSPAAWEVPAFHFSVLDRFSDSNEAGVLDNTAIPIVGGTTLSLENTDPDNAVRNETDAKHWRAGWLGCAIYGPAA